MGEARAPEKGQAGTGAAASGAGQQPHTLHGVEGGDAVRAPLGARRLALVPAQAVLHRELRTHARRLIIIFGMISLLLAWYCRHQNVATIFQFQFNTHGGIRLLRVS